MKKRLGIILLAVVFFITACGQEGLEEGEVEAIKLDSSFYWVVEAFDPDSQVKDKLLNLVNGSGHGQVGGRYRFKIGPLKESFPPQTEGQDFEEVSETTEVVGLNINHASSISGHLPDRAHLIDVRTAEEFNGGHLPGAINIDLNKLSDLAEKEVPAKDDILMVYCRSGARSREAGEILKDLGYRLVFDLGGIQDYDGDLEE